MSTSSTSSRRSKKGQLDNSFRQNYLNFQEKDPDDFYISETPFAGFGLFAARFFEKGEFLLNYRGDCRTGSVNDGIDVFDTGKPEHLAIDATDRKDSSARYVNDVDPYHLPNCYPMRKVNDCGKVLITFFASRHIDKDEELRYSYNSSSKGTPWRKEKFFLVKLRNLNQQVLSSPK